MTKKLLLVAVLVVAAVVVLQQLNQANLDTGLINESSDQPIQNQPSAIKQYSYNDILNNDEFKQKMQQAVATNDVELAKSLQQKAIEIALAAKLPANEVSLISGENGLRFMQFLASRQIFVEKFEDYYLAFKDIQQLKLEYPQAKDLFARSDELIESRDWQIQRLAEQLAGEDGNVELYLQLAKEQWIARQSAAN